MWPAYAARLPSADSLAAASSKVHQWTRLVGTIPGGCSDLVRSVLRLPLDPHRASTAAHRAHRFRGQLLVTLTLSARPAACAVSCCRDHFLASVLPRRRPTGWW